MRSSRTTVAVTKLACLRWLLLGIAISVCVALSLTPVSAASANISHAYHSHSAIPNGSIVSLDRQGSDYVELTNVTNGGRIQGVATASQDSLLAVDASSTTVQVATSGTALVLVSTVNGDIHVGDQVAASPFNGVGMRSEPGAHVIGLAQTNFSASSAEATVQTVTDKAGNRQQIHIGFSRVSIVIGVDATAGGSQQLNALQRLVKSVTGRTVSTARVVLSLLIAAVTILTLAALIYGAIYGSIISIGRNPLAKHATLGALRNVLAMALLTALIAGALIVFLLA